MLGTWNKIRGESKTGREQKLQVVTKENQNKEIKSLQKQGLWSTLTYIVSDRENCCEANCG